MSAGEDAKVTGASDPSTWVEQHGDALYRYALLRVRDADLAEELVQEAMVAALSARARFSGQSTERTWLIGILKNKIVDHIRRAVREQPVGDADEDLSGPISETFTERGLWAGKPRAWGGDPESAIQDREFWAAFQRCMGALPAPLASAFLLRELEQLNGEDVCQVLDISATNLWARLHRARLRLRQCLEGGWFARR